MKKHEESEKGYGISLNNNNKLTFEEESFKTLRGF